MAYSPFYITPEELAVYQEAQEQEILAGDNVRTWHKYDDCDYRDVAKTTVNRCHNRGRSFLFFKSTNDLKRVLEKLSEEYQLKCTEFEDIKALFNAYSPDDLLSEPARSLEFPLDDTFELRAQNAPIPEWEYLYNGK